VRSSFIALAVITCGANAVHGQAAPRPVKEANDAQNVPRPEVVVSEAIRSHPLTAPYPIGVSWRKGKVVLSGVVGTKQVHDIAVRLAMQTGVPFQDELKIDTAATSLVAESAAMAAPGAAAASSASPYIYPPPLMGRVDDPFFGFVPPLVSFPPWWRRRVENAPIVEPRVGAVAAAPGAAPAVPSFGAQNAPQGAGQPLAPDSPKGQIELTVDASGQVFLRGVVTSEEAAREIVAAARSVPGVTRVESDLQVQVMPRRAEGEDPPPPPEPVVGAPAPERPALPPPARRVPPAQEPVVVAERPAAANTGPAGLDSQVLTHRVISALERKPLAARLPVKVRSNEAVVTLTGAVPSAYEAMIAFRAAEQTPGVRDVVDRLEFVVPDEDHPNPLLQKGRPEDLEPYLASQIRRHVGDLAHIDRIRARGNVLELRGSLLSAQDRDRLLAILRSIPVLYGFRLETEFTED
jgi:osmotically-inducible protein OsmY